MGVSRICWTHYIFQYIFFGIEIDRICYLSYDIYILQTKSIYIN